MFVSGRTRQHTVDENGARDLLNLTGLHVWNVLCGAILSFILYFQFQGRVKELSNMFGRTGAPHFRGPHTCAKDFMSSKLRTGKNKENLSEKNYNRKYALLYTKLTLKLYDKMNRTRLFGLSFWSCGLAPHIFFQTGPPNLLIRPCRVLLSFLHSLLRCALRANRAIVCDCNDRLLCLQIRHTVYSSYIEFAHLYFRDKANILAYTSFCCHISSLRKRPPTKVRNRPMRKPLFVRPSFYIWHLNTDILMNRPTVSRNLNAA